MIKELGRGRFQRKHFTFSRPVSPSLHLRRNTDLIILVLESLREKALRWAVVAGPALSHDMSSLEGVQAGVGQHGSAVEATGR